MTSEKNITDSVITSLKTQTATWFVGLVIGILTIFSTHLTESIKIALNRADSRSIQYEHISKDLSLYFFSSELCIEYLENNWTTKDSLIPLITDYNNQITTIRKMEFVYLVWIRKYWDINHEKKFNNLVASIKHFDTQIHKLNDEFEAVNITGSKNKIDAVRTQEAVKILRPLFSKMYEDGKNLLLSLE